MGGGGLNLNGIPQGSRIWLDPELLSVPRPRSHRKRIWRKRSKDARLARPDKRIFEVHLFVGKYAGMRAGLTKEECEKANQEWDGNTLAGYKMHPSTFEKLTAEQKALFVIQETPKEYHFP